MGNGSCIMTAITEHVPRRPVSLPFVLSLLLLYCLGAHFYERSRHIPPPPLEIHDDLGSAFTPQRPSVSVDVALREQLMKRLRKMATISTPATRDERGVNRPFLSPAGTRARMQLHEYMAESGLTPHTDAAGNVIGDLRCESKSNRKVLAMGSHFDSVRGGGMWDGIYGVLAAVAVASAVARREAGVCELPFDLRVVAFDDEEGNNPFGTTNFGAKAYAGVLNLRKHVADLDALAARYEDVFPDFQVELVPDVEKALEKRLKDAAVDREQLLGYLELHIEQGPVLERLGVPLGAVSGIAGQTRLSVSIVGQGGHAGTVPMAGRRDALTAAAKAVGIVEEVGSGGGLVATVGVLQVEGGSSNVIPGHVGFTIDIRAAEDEVRRRAKEEIMRRIEELEERGVKVEWEVTHEIEAVGMTPWVTSVVESVVGGMGEVVGACGGVENCSRSYEGGVGQTTLTSGAGHDTQLMAKVTDVGMIFVRCRDGLSHHPDEHVDEEDAYEGARALLKVVEAVAEKVGRDC